MYLLAWVVIAIILGKLTGLLLQGGGFGPAMAVEARRAGRTACRGSEASGAGRAAML